MVESFDNIFIDNPLHWLQGFGLGKVTQYMSESGFPFETANNDPIVMNATFSITPGMYNGYKVDDVVWVAFEDGQMEAPVILGKLYLGAEKEKSDPRGTVNTENVNASNTATIPADTRLKSNVGKEMPNTAHPYSSLSSVANDLNELNKDVEYHN